MGLMDDLSGVGRVCVCERTCVSVWRGSEWEWHVSWETGGTGGELELDEECGQEQGGKGEVGSGGLEGVGEKTERIRKAECKR